MIVHQTELEMGSSVIVHGMDSFILVPFNGSTYNHSMNRAELTELRHIIDQALNTSAEELGDD